MERTLEAGQKHQVKCWPNFIAKSLQNKMLDRSPRRSVSIWKPCWRGLGQHGRSSNQAFMDTDEKRLLLAKSLEEFRSWTYESLAKEIDRTRREHECLQYRQGVFADGTEYKLGFMCFGMIGEMVTYEFAVTSQRIRSAHCWASFRFLLRM